MPATKAHRSVRARLDFRTDVHVTSKPKVRYLQVRKRAQFALCSTVIQQTKEDPFQERQCKVRSLTNKRTSWTGASCFKETRFETKSTRQVLPIWHQSRADRTFATKLRPPAIAVAPEEHNMMFQADMSPCTMSLECRKLSADASSTAVASTASMRGPLFS